jgi:hypothetical protein
MSGTLQGKVAVMRGAAKTATPPLRCCGDTSSMVGANKPPSQLEKHG